MMKSWRIFAQRLLLLRKISKSLRLFSVSEMRRYFYTHLEVDYEESIRPHVSRTG